jgi:hypothetical protein
VQKPLLTIAYMLNIVLYFTKDLSVDGDFRGQSLTSLIFHRSLDCSEEDENTRAVDMNWTDREQIIASTTVTCAETTGK